MSTALLIVIIVVVVLVVVAVAAALSRRAKQRELGREQFAALHDDVDRHRSAAVDKHHEADLAQERARRAAAEAELEDRRAAEREGELEQRTD